MPLPTVKSENSIDAHQDVDGLEELEHGGKEHSMSELLKHLQKEQSESEEVKLIERPIAELLENLLESHGQQKGTPKMNRKTKVKRSALTSKRNRSASLSYSTLDNGDHIEPMGASSDEEAEKFRLQAYEEDRIKSETLEISGRTITDKFQEVINAAAVNDQGMLLATSKQTGGYFSRLQQVMQTEKERHMEFLNQSRGAIRTDEAGFLDVKILSRYLDAKLTVCQCLSVFAELRSHQLTYIRGKPTEALRGGSVKQVSFYDDDVRYWQHWRNRTAAAEAPAAVIQQLVSNSPAPSTRGRHFVVICCENKAIFLDLVTMRGRDVPKQELDNKSLL